MTKLEKDLLQDVQIMANIIHKMDVTISVLIKTLHEQNIIDGFELRDDIESVYDTESKSMIQTILKMKKVDDSDDIISYPHFGPIGEA
jgi:hypothetical protein